MSRGYTTGRFALEIDNVNAGWIYSAEGGNRVSEVVIEKLPQEHHSRKHIVGLKYEDITITCGIGMTKHFWHKLKASFQDSYKRLDGAIHVCDFDGNIQKTLNCAPLGMDQANAPATSAEGRARCAS